MSSTKILNFKNWQSLLSQLYRGFGIITKSVSLFLIRAYQIIASPIFGGACRFHPSCSCYAQQAFDQHDSVTASILVFKRLAQCRPFGRYGFDPVPERKYGR